MSFPFVHLQVHSGYSIIDGKEEPDALFAKAKAYEMPALGICDLSNVFAAVKTFKAAQKHKVKPIFGADVYVDFEDESPKLVSVLCENETGFLRLRELLSDAYLAKARNQDQQPIIPKEALSKASLEGLVMVLGYESFLADLLLQDKSEVVEQRITFLQQVLGTDALYLAISRIDFANEAQLEEHFLSLAIAQDLGVIASQKVCFLEPEAFMAHEVRTCIFHGDTLEDPHRKKRYSAKQYFADTPTMLKCFEDLPQVLENTYYLAQRLNVKIPLGDVFLPDFPTPDQMPIDQYLSQVAQKGLEQRFAAMKTLSKEQKKTYQARLDRELEVINKMGFAGYFLIVADFIHWSKEHGVPVGPGRGSGAGSLVAYALLITDLDPLPYDLLFERFLNPERVSMPDFDIDFCIEGRDRVIDYVAQRYGRLAVSQIVTFGTMAAKAVVRDVGRVLGFSYGFVDRIAKMIPMDLGMTLAQALKDEPQLKDWYDNDEPVKAIIDMGLKLEGTVRNVGKHAGGVVIAPTKLSDFTAIYCESGSEQIVAQYDKNDVEAVGLVKFDFLGLRNLTIIAHTLERVNRNMPKDQHIKIEDIALDDPKTFDLLKACNTTAVFQLESRGMKDLIRRLVPDCFEEIIALVALFRPGPLQSGMVDDFIDRKHGKSEVVYLHPSLEEALKPTYGVILYQEQVMLISQILAGYNLGQADLLRRAMGKKKPEEMAKQRTTFVQGSVKNGVDEKQASEIFDLMEKFAGYGFNKSHSAAYALVAYQTAWLKAHYPAEFMAAVLSSDMDNTDKVVAFVEDAWHMGLKVFKPCINQSKESFSVVEGGILFGLGAIKGVGENVIAVLLADRDQNGPYKDLYDFCRRLALSKMNKRVVEALIDAGAMDAIAPNRAVLLANSERAMAMGESYQRDQASGQHDLFGLDGADSNSTASSQEQYIHLDQRVGLVHSYKEKKVIGFFLSSHPFSFYQNIHQNKGITPLSQIAKVQSKKIKVAGVITAVRRIKTKSGRILFIIALDDKTARYEVSAFEEAFMEYEENIKLDQIVVMEVSVRHDAYSASIRLSLQGAWDIEGFMRAKVHGITLRLESGKSPASLVESLKAITLHHQGPVPVRLQYHYKNQLLDLVPKDPIKLKAHKDTITALEALLGKAQVVVE